MGENFSLSSDLAHELELAFRRTQWTAEEVKKLTGGGTLAHVREVVLGRSEIKVIRPKVALLQILGTVVVPATLAPFVARDAFVVNTGRKVQAKIACLGSNFKEWFLDKIEEPMGETVLRYARLLRPSADEQILAELGHLKEATLGAIFYLMSCQGDPEKSVLLTNGWGNGFYVPDALGILRAVRVRLDGDGWNVRADSVGDPRRWGTKYRFFSRNSSVHVIV